jgi:hypothetical protein
MSLMPISWEQDGLTSPGFVTLKPLLLKHPLNSNAPQRPLFGVDERVSGISLLKTHKSSPISKDKEGSDAS